MKCNAHLHGLAPCQTDVTPERLHQEKTMCPLCDELRFFVNAALRVMNEATDVPFRIGQRIAECPFCRADSWDVMDTGTGDHVAFCTYCRAVAFFRTQHKACYVV